LWNYADDVSLDVCRYPQLYLVMDALREANSETEHLIKPLGILIARFEEFAGICDAVFVPKKVPR